jgi:hypothetical protein
VPAVSALAISSAGRGIQPHTAHADSALMIWPVAALAASFLCFVVVYGTRLQARIDAARNTGS